MPDAILYKHVSAHERAQYNNYNWGKLHANIAADKIYIHKLARLALYTPQHSYIFYTTIPTHVAVTH